MSGIDAIHSSALAGLPHAFLGRGGGVSTGAVAGLNTGLGSGDDPDMVMENRRRAVAAVLAGATLVGVYQVHGATCVTVREPWGHDSRPEADALVTDRPNILLSIVTADCTPVLFADIEEGIVGAAHAGWRGALAGVTDATIEAMERLGARRDHIVAAVGPCIAQASYEVDEAFQARFVDEDEGNARFFAEGENGRPHFDLPRYVRHRLLAAGIGEVETLHLDTYADPDRFYSYRRSTHRGEATYGRQISMIGLRA